MGSKRHMLGNGLGKTVIEETEGKERFFDLFAGSGAVSWFAAQNTSAQVIATDLQSYSAALALAVLSRTETIAYKKNLSKWIREAVSLISEADEFKLAQELQLSLNSVSGVVEASRIICSANPSTGTIWYAYGGYYYSPLQALKLDALRSTLPEEEPFKSVALAGLISAASDCAAAPGHTAQPLQPTASGIKHVRAAWRKDPFTYIRSAIEELAKLKSKKLGAVYTGDAYLSADELHENDIAFIDPPYSDVHYSRFYHVLETVCKGCCGDVSGTGRYPPVSERPTSEFSRKGNALEEFRRLMEKVASRGATAIVTYPEGNCSNNLSGTKILEISSELFFIERYTVTKQFSTLGGNNLGTRPARQAAGEMVIVLRSK